MPEKVLSQDWSDYDNRKIRDKREPAVFSCMEIWEIDYLVDKIKQAYPNYFEIAIHGAISLTCKNNGAPHPREVFVEEVIKRLKEQSKSLSGE